MDKADRTSAVTIHGLRVNLGGNEVLKGIDLDLPKGGIVGLLGPNGAGKTTLIRSIVGRQRTSSGTIQIFGQRAGSVGLRRRIGYMTQTPAVYGDLNVKENLRYFASMAGQSNERIQEVLSQVELNEQVGQLANNLSGGQKSRASLAVALLGKPDLLLLDEPTVGLDPVLRRRLWQVFKDLADSGSTLLVSSHVMDEAAYCDSLAFISDGRVIAHGSAEQLMKQTKTDSIEDSFISLAGGGK